MRNWWHPNVLQSSYMIRTLKHGTEPWGTYSLTSQTCWFNEWGEPTTRHMKWLS